MKTATDRSLVYVQVHGSRWTNYKGYKTTAEAYKGLEELKAEYPKAQLRVLDENLYTHTK